MLKSNRIAFWVFCFPPLFLNRYNSVSHESNSCHGYPFFVKCQIFGIKAVGPKASILHNTYSPGDKEWHHCALHALWKWLVLSLFRYVRFSWPFLSWLYERIVCFRRDPNIVAMAFNAMLSQNCLNIKLHQKEQCHHWCAVGMLIPFLYIKTVRCLFWGFFSGARSKCVCFE